LLGLVFGFERKTYITVHIPGYSFAQRVKMRKNGPSSRTRCIVFRNAAVFFFTMALALALVYLPFLMKSERVLAQPNIPDQNTWVTDGDVNAIASAGSIIYVGVQFTHIGPYTGNGAALNITSGSPMPFDNYQCGVRTII
jgi:hypothetical protein